MSSSVVFIPSRILLVSLVVVVVVMASFSSLIAADQIGAVYQVSNDPNFNGVLVFSIASNGSLTFVKSVPTGGAGAGGARADPLGSENAIVVSGTDLFVVNAVSNSISYFTVDVQDATRLNFVASAATFGDYPTSVAAFGDVVCALAAGLNNGFRCWQFSESTGLNVLASWDRSLTAYSPTNGNPPASGLSLGQIAFTPNGDAIIVAVRGPSQGHLLRYAITNANNGASLLLAASPVDIQPTNAITTFGFAFTSANNNNGDNDDDNDNDNNSGNAVIVASDPHGANKPGGVDVVAFDRNGNAVFAEFQAYTAPNSNNALTTAPCWAVYSPVADGVFVFDAATSFATLISVSRNSTGYVATAVGSINLRKGVFDASYVSVDRRTEYWYVNTPTNGASVTGFVVSRSSNHGGVVSIDYLGSFSAPASANVGIYTHGSAAFLQARRTH